jgi:hypothetical protein
MDSTIIIIRHRSRMMDMIVIFHRPLCLRNNSNSILRDIANILNHIVAALRSGKRGSGVWWLMHGRGVFRNHIHLLGEFNDLFEGISDIFFLSGSLR